MELLISLKKVSQVLVLVVLCLTLANIIGQFTKYILGHGYLLGFVQLFDLGTDSFIPTWYASTTLLLCSILLAMITYVKRREADRFALHWGILSLIFLFLSIDEVALIHETIGDTIKRKLSANLYGFFYYTWVIPGAAFILIFAAAYLKFLIYLPAKTRQLFIFAGLIYIGGALGLEMVNARHDELYGNNNLTYKLMTTAEEFFEMIGIVIFIHALMSYMVSQVEKVVISITPTTKPLSLAVE